MGYAALTWLLAAKAGYLPRSRRSPVTPSCRCSPTWAIAISRSAPVGPTGHGRPSRPCRWEATSWRSPSRPPQRRVGSLDRGVRPGHLPDRARYELPRLFRFVFRQPISGALTQSGYRDGCRRIAGLNRRLLRLESSGQQYVRPAQPIDAPSASIARRGSGSIRSPSSRPARRSPERLGAAVGRFRHALAHRGRPVDLGHPVGPLDRSVLPHLAGAPWIAKEWLSQLVFFGAYAPADGGGCDPVPPS
jgi:hypothetical protein